MAVGQKDTEQQKEEYWEIEELPNGKGNIAVFKRSEVLQVTLLPKGGGYAVLKNGKIPIFGLEIKAVRIES